MREYSRRIDPNLSNGEVTGRTPTGARPHSRSSRCTGATDGNRTPILPIEAGIARSLLVRIYRVGVNVHGRPKYRVRSNTADRDDFNDIEGLDGVKDGGSLGQYATLEDGDWVSAPEAWQMPRKLCEIDPPKSSLEGNHTFGQDRPIRPIN